MPSNVDEKKVPRDSLNVLSDQEQYRASDFDKESVGGCLLGRYMHTHVNVVVGAAALSALRDWMRDSGR